MGAELVCEKSQIDAFDQTESQKEFFLQSCLTRHYRAGRIPARYIVFKRIRSRESAFLHLVLRSEEHRMGIDTKSQIRLPRPVLQIMPRLKSLAREAGNLVLINSAGVQTLAGSFIHVRGQFIIR